MCLSVDKRWWSEVKEAKNGSDSFCMQIFD
jgi:hypothetical protein